MRTLGGVFLSAQQQEDSREQLGNKEKGQHVIQSSRGAMHVGSQHYTTTMLKVEGGSVGKKRL